MKSIGISKLIDFNYYTLSNLKSLLNKEILEDIVPILKKFFLPSSLENLNLSKEFVNILKKNKINDLHSILEFNSNFLKKIVSEDNAFAEQIENILDFYNVQDNCKFNNNNKNKFYEKKVHLKTKKINLLIQIKNKSKIKNMEAVNMNILKFV